MRRPGVRALVDGDAMRASAELGEALRLWRGDALADCRGGGWAAAEAVRLDELRLSTVEDRIEADLMLGHHGVLVGELESLVARHPLRERLWAALMLALYRAGRQADAVRAYQRARDVLVGQLGLEPGAELRRLEAAVLAGDPTLDHAVARRPRRPPSSRFRSRVGSGRHRRRCSCARAQELEHLNGSLTAVAAGERLVVLVSGEPGIGKTALSAAFARDAFENGAVRVVWALRRGSRPPRTSSSARRWATSSPTPPKTTLPGMSPCIARSWSVSSPRWRAGSRIFHPRRQPTRTPSGSCCSAAVVN